MAQDTTPAIICYQGDGSNSVFDVPFDKGYYGEIKVLFVRRGLADYTYNPDTFTISGRLYAWQNGGAKIYTHTPNPAVGAPTYNSSDVEQANTVSAIAGQTITVDSLVYTRAAQHDISSNMKLTWTGDMLEVGDFICIVRDTGRGQPYEMPNNQKHIERALDNIERQVQELQAATDNALKIDPSHDIPDSHKMNPIDWLETIIRSTDKSVRALRYLNGWLDYSLDDPNVADADKTWAHLLNADNIKSIRERKEIEDGEEHCWVEYLDQNGQWQLLVDSDWDARIEEVERIAGEAKQIADEAKGVADEAKEIAEGIDGKAQQALDNSIQAVETAEEAKNLIQNQIIVRSATIPTASAELVGKAYQYAGVTNGQYTHNYIYECVAGETTYTGIIGFEPTKIAFDYTVGDVVTFFREITSSFPQVTHGTFTYDMAGNIWTIVGKDADENVVFDNYRLYTEDLEDAGFVFINPPQDYADGEVIDFAITFTPEPTSYSWVRVDVQPDRIAEIQALQADITDIQALIPAQASPTNQLGDKAFINSSIATNTANFIGTFNSIAELEAYSGTVTNNDYAFVIGTDSAGNTTYNRYKYNANTQQWIYEYTLNNSSFTADQWTAINSNVTPSDVAKARSAVQPSDLGNGTITVSQGGVVKGTFTTNQDSNATIDLDPSTWIRYISNYIVEIPQDIRLTIDNSYNLVLTSGSSAYLGDGTKITVATNLTYPAAATQPSTQFIVMLNSAGTALQISTLSSTTSAATNPGGSYRVWLNTTDGKCYWNDGSANPVEYSLPIAIATHTNGTGWTKINRVFNGFGYVGSTIFALPGVKFLAPAGRNSDGTLNNDEITIGQVYERTFSSATTEDLILYNGGFTTASVHVVNNESDIWDNGYFYSINENQCGIYSFTGSKGSWTTTGRCVCGKFTTEQSGRISSLNLKQPFHAVDMSNSGVVIDEMLPTADNDYTWYRKYHNGWIEQGGTTVADTDSGYTITLPHPMADANYIVLTTPESTSASGENFSTSGIRGKTASTITVWANSAYMTKKYWRVEGMAAY